MIKAFDDDKKNSKTGAVICKSKGLVFSIRLSLDFLEKYLLKN